MDNVIKEAVRELRKNQTKAEKLFWNEVRNRKLEGFKFLRQHPFLFEYEGGKRFFIADFYCAEKKMIVGIDGYVHKFQKDQDMLRTNLLNEMGLRVIRFQNHEILTNIPTVLEKLKQILTS
jgi:very-short-patch-repair endonuclease